MRELQIKSNVAFWGKNETPIQKKFKPLVQKNRTNKLNPCRFLNQTRTTSVEGSAHFIASVNVHSKRAKKKKKKKCLVFTVCFPSQCVYHFNVMKKVKSGPESFTPFPGHDRESVNNSVITTRQDNAFYVNLNFVVFKS